MFVFGARWRRWLTVLERDIRLTGMEGGVLMKDARWSWGLLREDGEGGEGEVVVKFWGCPCSTAVNIVSFLSFTPLHSIVISRSFIDV